MNLRFSRHRILTVLLVAVVAAACSIFIPKKTDRIIFSHKVHSEEDVDCEDCHEQITQDAERVVQAIPTKPQCAECHEDEVEDDCKMCHTDVASPASWPKAEPSTIVYSHQTHLARETKCADCHSEMTDVHVVGFSKYKKPQHKQCDTCHKEDLEAGRCRLCHRRLDLYNRKPESLYSHRKGYFDRHGKEARAFGGEHCSFCHDQSYCTDCHARTMTVRPSVRFPERVDQHFMHSGDWQGRHVMEARMSDSSCMKCHGRSSCDACHERVGVGGRLGGSPHKDEGDKKWAPGSRLAPDFSCSGDFLHGRAARRRIIECASCHDQGPVSICIRCHRADGQGCNPHPPGFEARVSSIDRDSNKMCRICHN